MKNIEVVCCLYRELVGADGSRDVPGEFPLEGYYFCPLPLPSKLWVNIRFGHMKGDMTRQSAILQVYIPGAGADGNDAPYLEIQAFTGPGADRFEVFSYERQPDRDPACVAQCAQILEHFRSMVGA